MSQSVSARSLRFVCSKSGDVALDDVALGGPSHFDVDVRVGNLVDRVRSAPLSEVVEAWLERDFEAGQPRVVPSILCA